MRIAARYQENGTLVAVRMWASSDFNNVWLSPEGHVLHVNAANDVITGDNESGVAVPVTVDANTQFFFRTPANAAWPMPRRSAPVPASLPSQDLVRGFKVHVSVVDPLGDAAGGADGRHRNGGLLGAASRKPTPPASPTRTISARRRDDYSVTLDYIACTTRQRHR